MATAAGQGQLPAAKAFKNNEAPPNRRRKIPDNSQRLPLRPRSLQLLEAAPRRPEQSRALAQRRQALRRVKQPRALAASRTRTPTRTRPRLGARAVVLGVLAFSWGSARLGQWPGPAASRPGAAAVASRGRRRGRRRRRAASPLDARLQFSQRRTVRTSNRMLINGRRLSVASISLLPPTPPRFVSPRQLRLARYFTPAPGFSGDLDRRL